MTAIASIKDLDLYEKRVFIRADFNCPLHEGRLTDDTRIRAALPTIHYALEQKARVILASHLGRPAGTGFEEAYSLVPVGERLAELLGDAEIIFPEDCIGDAVRKLAHDLRPGQVMLLENLRFHAQETANDATFASALAALADVYVNDAFGCAHRAHASIEALPRLMEHRGAGLLLEKELHFLGTLFDNPTQPCVAILGGAKVSDKLDLIDSLLGLVDVLIIGGGMAYTFLQALGINVGGSLVEATKVHSAHKVIDRARTKGVRLLLPQDHMIAQAFEATAGQPTATAEIPDGWLGLDIGPKTVAAFAKAIAAAKTIVWNGPVGRFETPAFAQGTLAIAKAVAASAATTIVGGGDSVAALHQAGVADRVTHVSTGGGACLEFLEGKKLPGVVALQTKSIQPHSAAGGLV